MENIPEQPSGISKVASKGGIARANSLTPERRKEIARKAIEARWAKAGHEPVPTATHGSPEKPLQLGGTPIPCYVLSDQRRVLSLGGLLKVLNMSLGSAGGGDGNSRLARFSDGKRLSPFISDELRLRMTNPIRFIHPHGGNEAYGYEAVILPEICEAVLAARAANALYPHQQNIAKRCEVLARGLMRVGIVALVDEATGFQADRERDALAKILESFIAKELRPYIPTFEPDFYKEMFRLKGIEFKGTLKAPRYIGKVTNDLVYDRLAPGIREELNRINPNNEKGQRKHKNFQWLTQQIGYQRLKQHLAAVTVLMKVFDDWDVFKKNLDRALPRQDAAPLFDPPSTT